MFDLIMENIFDSIKHLVQASFQGYGPPSVGIGGRKISPKLRDDAYRIGGLCGSNALCRDVPRARRCRFESEEMEHADAELDANNRYDKDRFRSDTRQYRRHNRTVLA